MSINEGAIAVLGWQSCTDKSSFTHAILQALCRSINLIWTHRLKNIRRRFMILFFMAQTGKEVKVFYKGQRGEGVYDVAFEGLIKT